MLSVGESARQLGVSPSRVRALIKEGRLPAAKNGREWMIREEDVLQRLMASPRAGRPHDLYDACRHAFGHLPPTEMMKAARCQEEASFYMAVFDFFLQQRQRELVKEGVF